MFKRVEKKRKRGEEEEKLGLDEEMKEALGMQDTDSDESDSESEEDSDGEGASDDEDEMEEEEEEEEEEGHELSTDEEEKPPIPIHSALLDPLYIISLDPQITKACIVCPGKILKSKDMFEIHKNSKAHSRRFKKFSEKAATAELESNAWIIVDQMNEMTASQPGFAGTDGLSKRAQKRKARSAAIKERYAKRKAAAKAKKEAKLKTDTTSFQEKAKSRVRCRGSQQTSSTITS